MLLVYCCLFEKKRKEGETFFAFLYRENHALDAWFKKAF